MPPTRPGELWELGCLKNAGFAGGSGSAELTGALGKGREFPEEEEEDEEEDEEEEEEEAGECMDGEKGARDLGIKPGLPRCRGDRNCGAGIPGLFMGELPWDRGWEFPAVWLKATLDPRGFPKFAWPEAGLPG